MTIERVDLFAITWLGGGDFVAEEWEEARRLARECHDKREAEHLATTSLLVDFPDGAFYELGYTEEEIEETIG